MVGAAIAIKINSCPETKAIISKQSIAFSFLCLPSFLYSCFSSSLGLSPLAEFAVSHFCRAKQATADNVYPSLASHYYAGRLCPCVAL